MKNIFMFERSEEILGGEMMSIDEKDLDLLLEENDIEAPEEKVNSSLNNKFLLLNKKSKIKLYLYKGILVAVIFLISTYIFITPFRVWANETIENILHDIGIQSAIDKGYPKIEDVNVKIGEYNIKIHDIYMDAYRIIFKTTVEGLEISDDEREKTWYVLSLDESIDNVAIGSYEFTNDSPTSSINIEGEGVSELFENENDEFIFELVLEEKKPGNKNNYEEVGKNLVEIKIPKELYNEPNNYDFSEECILSRGEITLEKLAIYPTIMKVEFNSILNDGNSIESLMNLKIVDSNGEIYDDNTIFPSSHNENGWISHNLIPSFYFKDVHKVSIEADGFIYNPKEKNYIKLSLNDTYPKEIDYLGKKVVIQGVEYNSDELLIRIKEHDDIREIMHNVLIDEMEYRYGIGKNSQSGDYTIFIDIDEREEYNIDFNFTFINHEYIQFNINLDK